MVLWISFLQILRLFRERRVLLQLQLHKLQQQPPPRAATAEIDQAMSRQKSKRFQAKGKQIWKT